MGLSMLRMGEAIHTARRSRGLTQAQIAAQVGVSQGHVSQIERGRSTDAGAMMKLCKLLELDVQALMLEDLGARTRVETEIQNDPALRPDDRQLLLEIYKVMKNRGPLAEAGSAHEA